METLTYYVLYLGPHTVIEVAGMDDKTRFGVEDEVSAVVTRVTARSLYDTEDVGP